MRSIRFQNRIAASSVTLPAAAVLASVLWCAHTSFSPSLLMAWICCGLTTYTIIELVNTYALIRIRTSLTPALYLVAMGAMTWLHNSVEATFTAFCLALSYFALFRAYSKPQPVHSIFLAFLLLGCGSCICPPLCILAVCYWGYMASYLRCLTPHTFSSSVLGLLLPYWIWAGGCIYNHNFAPLAEHLDKICTAQPLSTTFLAQLSHAQVAATLHTLFLALLCIVHYLQTDFNDKIRIRMYFFLLIIQELVLGVAAILFTQYSQVWMVLCQLNTCFLSAHYFALTSSRLSNLIFISTLFIYTAIAVASIIWK